MREEPMTQNPAFYMSLLVDVFIYLKGRVTERERESYSLVYFPNGCIAHVSGGMWLKSVQALMPPPCCFPSHINKMLGQRRSSWDSHMRCWPCKPQLNHCATRAASTSFSLIKNQTHNAMKMSVVVLTAQNHLEYRFCCKSLVCDLFLSHIFSLLLLLNSQTDPAQPRLWTRSGKEPRNLSWSIKRLSHSFSLKGPYGVTERTLDCACSATNQLSVTWPTRLSRPQSPPCG